MRHILNSTAVLVLMLGAPAGAATYEISDLPLAPTYGGTASVSDISINNVGTIAHHYVSRPSGGSASSNVGNILVDPTVGPNSLIQTGTGFDALFEGRDPVINDNGAILARFSAPDSATGGVIQRLRVLEPDGSVRDVAYLAANPTGDPISTEPAFRSISSPRMNNAGEVVALVTTLDNTQQIVVFPNDGSAHRVIAEATSDFFTFNRPAINDDGEVAFIATRSGSSNPSFSSSVGIYRGDGTTLELVVETPAIPGPSGTPDINNDGDIFFGGAVPGSGEPVTVLIEAGSSTPVVTQLGNTPGEYVTAAFINDYGQTAYVFDNEFYIDGVKVAGLGDIVEGLGEIANQPGAFGPVGALPGVSFNNLGQAVIGAFVDTTPGEVGGIEVTRALVDPNGGTPDNPVMPFASTPEGENDLALNIFNGLGVDAPIFVDPIVATGFTYSLLAGAPNFASLIIPDALPGGDNMFEISFDGMLETLGVGTTFDFRDFVAGGVSTFTILGIDPAEGVDPTAPFVVGLTFISGGFQTTLSIDAITVDTDPTDPNVVPLPLSAPLLGGGLVLLALIGGRRQSRRQTG